MRRRRCLMAVLAAVILVGGCDDIASGTARPAPGEVAVDFFGNGDPSAQGSADIKTSAVDIVHAMLALS